MGAKSLTVDRDGWTGRVQLSINDDEGFGHRLLGPKYNGSSENIATLKLGASERQVLADELGFARLLKAAKALVDRDVAYDGNSALISADSHAEAIRLVTDLRSAIDKAEVWS